MLPAARIEPNLRETSPGFPQETLENQRVFCHNIGVASAKERTITMRIRKEQEDMQDAEISLIATVSDALAHPARIHMFRYIMQANRAMVAVLQQRPCRTL